MRRFGVRFVCARCRLAGVGRIVFQRHGFWPLGAFGCLAFAIARRAWKACGQSFPARPAAPPKAIRKAEREYDRETYKRRNETERLFWRTKGCRRIFTRFDKLDAKFPGSLNLPVVVEMMYDSA